MAQNNMAPDRAAAERALIELLGDGAVRRERARRRRALAARLTRPSIVARPPRVASSAAMAVTVTLPDGKALELPDGATGADAAAAIGPGLARAALAVEVSHRGGRTTATAGGARPRAPAARRRAHRDPHREERASRRSS